MLLDLGTERLKIPLPEVVDIVLEVIRRNYDPMS
jgi:hypothetical protein